MKEDPSPLVAVLLPVIQVEGNLIHVLGSYSIRHAPNPILR